MAITLQPSPPPSYLNNFVNTSDEKEENHGKIPFSSVVVRRTPKAYWGRKWTVMDIVYALLMFAMHVLCLFAPFYFTWGAFVLAFTLYVVFGLGITLGYHRNLTHQSFKLPKWLEYIFAYCGVQAVQGGPIEWVSNHRFHHKHTDKHQDPHSPTEGFWFCYFLWIFNHDYITQKCGNWNNVADLQKQWFYRFLQRTFVIHPLAFAVLLYKFCGFPYLVWAMGVRLTCGHHITFQVNSVCHIWGNRPWNTGDLSRNNWLVALISFGEGWHNNHHAFEYSARHGLEWWQLDFTWCVIKLLECIGLAKDVKIPSEIQKKKMSLKNGSSYVQAPCKAPN